MRRAEEALFTWLAPLILAGQQLSIGSLYSASLGFRKSYIVSDIYEYLNFDNSSLDALKLSKTTKQPTAAVDFNLPSWRRKKV